MFQSAPLTEARGDFIRLRLEKVNSVFQSAPLTEARGDRNKRLSWAPFSGFNPLPSPKRGETQQVCQAGCVLLGFQSAPLTEARGDQ